ncbi:CCA tRNA nucleotidyltransferase [Candidatus Woesearchaeota archaeon]|jgi:tRNA nucleotidyltransferase (CCA-adding enzyme)|nr:CCA tRNA nucleotidyltransferase [Candidatus Woesearchaeota archaeon]MBT4150986.1 CCA tRNA nucleotidyltransferase [Candidatus Woesearchaeota archaeon]MBT4433776.1 CCA tRNA nucleotidyltransferase [Candidatus Woesearchaeota archaeon]MBT7332657.1 CCA tRNA nucleotidyltransferase [Candidatus Woesearchaeota archaeon]
MKEILKRIKPKKEEIVEFQKITEEFLKKLNKKLKNAEVVLGGSGAKGTWLTKNHDIDCFARFDYDECSHKTMELSDMLEEGLKKAFPKIKIKRVHGSRDYFQLLYKDFEFEVVPVLKIRTLKEALNITDISPLHADWVNKHTKKLKDEILLAKQFFKAQKLYGAESHIGGFSGYTLEILMIHYGSFENLLKAAEKWKEGMVVDVEKHYPKKDALFNLNKSKHSILTLIDPIDKCRNALAALTKEKFLLTKKVARQYLKNHDVSFFERKPFDIQKLQKQAKKNHLLLLKVDPLEGKADVVGMKIIKVHDHLVRKLQDYDIVKSGWEWDKGEQGWIYAILGKNELPKIEERVGPPTHLKEAVHAFKKKHKKTSVKKMHVVAEVRREFTLLDDFVKNVFKDKYVKEKIKKIKIY